MSQLTDSDRKKAFDRHGEECVFCGTTRDEHREDHGRDLDIHHVIPKRKGGSDNPDNLIPVCMGCHRTIEATQGEALSRIANDELDRQELEDRNNDLREKVRGWKTEASELESHISKILEGVDTIFNESGTIEIYVVHETRFSTSRLLYIGTDIEDAKEKFESAENHVTMETTNIKHGINAEDLDNVTLRRIRDKSGILADRLEDRISETEGGE